MRELAEGTIRTGLGLARHIARYVAYHVAR
jgi:hypothetical protein